MGTLSRRWIALAAVAVVAGSACRGRDESERAESAAPPETPPATTAPATVPSTAPAHPPAGPLTVDALLAAKRGVKPYDAWDAAMAHLEATAGKPMRVEGNRYGWYVLDGAECHVLEVVRDEGAQRIASVLYGPFDHTSPQYPRCFPGPPAGATPTPDAAP